MLETDKHEFIEILKATQEYYDRPVSGRSVDIYWSGLSGITINQFSAAVTSHIKSSRFMPKVSDILEALPDTSGWLNPEEAWNALPKTESDGGYINQAIAQAMGACLDSLERGDYIAARMAFIESYKSRVSDLKMKGEKPKWWYSGAALGTHEQKQQAEQAALIIARDNKWITQDKFKEDNKRIAAPISQDNEVLKLIHETNH